MARFLLRSISFGLLLCALLGCTVSLSSAVIQIELERNDIPQPAFGDTSPHSRRLDALETDIPLENLANVSSKPLRGTKSHMLLLTTSTGLGSVHRENTSGHPTARV